MEILNNFNSIYCLITFIVGAGFMLAMYSIAAMGKDDEPRNRVRFFVERISCSYFLHINGKDNQYPIASELSFKDFGLNPDDFADMKEGQLREVFINLED